MTRYDGPVVIETSDEDPGDMGEPRQFTADGVTYLTVPPPEAWGWKDLQAALARADRWIDEYGFEMPAKDHACAECVPNGPIVVPGFQCVPHEAMARRAR